MKGKQAAFIGIGIAAIAAGYFFGGRMGNLSPPLLQPEDKQKLRDTWSDLKQKITTSTRGVYNR